MKDCPMVEKLLGVIEMMSCAPCCNSRWKDDKPCDCDDGRAKVILAEVIAELRKFNTKVVK